MFYGNLDVYGYSAERTYSEPRKWMRGKGRVTIQFGCCYNYATVSRKFSILFYDQIRSWQHTDFFLKDKDGNLPGIVRSVEADPMPPLLISMIKRMVSWRVLPPTCVPNSCIINLYDKDDCIPPHIDHHDFLRPFCTVSFLSECNILFGANLKVLGPGEFSGSLAIPLPLGYVNSILRNFYKSLLQSLITHVLTGLCLYWKAMVPILPNIVFLLFLLKGNNNYCN